MNSDIVRILLDIRRTLSIRVSNQSYTSPIVSGAHSSLILASVLSPTSVLSLDVGSRLAGISLPPIHIWQKNQLILPLIMPIN